MENIDLLIVGAGVVGSIVAEKAASQKGWRSLIVEKRNHIAGNCYDEFHESGLLIHRYGPHYFRTNNAEVFNYLSKFTQWIEGNYIVKTFSQGQLFPFPINLDTLEQFYGVKVSPQSGMDLLNSIRDQTIKNPQNSEEFVLSRVGRDLYNAFYLGYTLKQWDRHPAELAPSVCGRIPVRMNRDHRYVDHKYQMTPRDGFSRMFQRIIDKPEIKVLLNTDFDEVRQSVKPRIATLYTGPIDQYFHHEYGKLPWRSLEFDFKHYPEPQRQSCVQINYPNDFDYTRTVEIKHVTRQTHPHTVVSYEYPRSSGDPYYPIPASENKALYQRYEEAAEKEKKERSVYFSGRLACYTYINTDEAVEMAFSTYDRIVKDNESSLGA